MPISGEADFCSANFSSANLAGATLDGADLGNTDLTGIKWQSIKSVKGTSLQEVRNAPSGFLEWAAQHGAVTGGGIPIANSTASAAGCLLRQRGRCTGSTATEHSFRLSE